MIYAEATLSGNSVDDELASCRALAQEPLQRKGRFGDKRYTLVQRVGHNWVADSLELKLSPSGLPIVCDP